MKLDIETLHVPGDIGRYISNVEMFLFFFCAQTTKLAWFLGLLHLLVLRTASDQKLQSNKKV